DQQDEEVLVMAAAACLPSRSVSLARLAAERSGVGELLPPLLAPAPLERAYAAILDHWRGCFAAEAGRERAPIAVVITTYAPSLALLAPVLESLALQTLWPEEIWLVDDGSPPDAAGALAELVASCRRRLGLPLRLLRRPRNQGQYGCRNLVVEATKAEALAIQDDDDLSHPLRLALQWQALQQGRAAVYARHLRLDQADAAPQPDGDGGFFFGDGITTLMVGTTTARQLGGFYPVRSRGDVEFRGRLERRFGGAQVQRLEQPLYLMRGATSTLSSRFEYGCSLALPGWRALMAREVLV
ncbi:MAG: glycosyltransferase family 2 protein, partial [Prochlorococcaceae cyanobacterium]